MTNQQRQTEVAVYVQAVADFLEANGYSSLADACAKLDSTEREVQVLIINRLMQGLEHGAEH